MVGLGKGPSKVEEPLAAFAFLCKAPRCHWCRAVPLVKLVSVTPLSFRTGPTTAHWQALPS